jgi:hypothetical protein
VTNRGKWQWQICTSSDKRREEIYRINQELLNQGLLNHAFKYITLEFTERKRERERHLLRVYVYVRKRERERERDKLIPTERREDRNLLRAEVREREIVYKKERKKKEYAD